MSRVFNIVDRMSAALFGTLSRMRGKRVFHPKGDAYTGTVTITQSVGLENCVLLNNKKVYPIIARLSRGIGLPPSLPDILGFALRIPDIYGFNKHQDILMLTAGKGSFTHYIPFITRSFFAHSFSSILPYAVSDKKYLFGIVPLVSPKNHAAITAKDLHMLSQTSKLSFSLCIAAPLGKWREIGRIQLTTKVPTQTSEELRFNPWNTGGGIQPLGFLNRLRKNTYKASQKARLGK